MIRFVLYLLVFVLGLGGAALWLGEMRHLRQASPQPLPPWSETIQDSARIPQGEARLAVAGLPLVRLSWQDMALRGDGVHWQLRLVGPGLAAQSVLRVPFWPGEAFVQDGRGSVEIEGQRYDVAGIEGAVPLMGPAREGHVTLTLAPGTELAPQHAQLLARYAQVDGLRVRVPVRLR